MEKMTASVFAVVHGDDGEPLAVAETFEAETREELAAEFARTLREIADGVEKIVK